MTRSFIIPAFQGQPAGRPSDADYQAKSKSRLLGKGGMRLPVNLPPDAVLALRKIMVRDGFATKTDAVIAALHHYARNHP